MSPRLHPSLESCHRAASGLGKRAGCSGSAQPAMRRSFPGSFLTWGITEEAETSLAVNLDYETSQERGVERGRPLENFVSSVL